MRESLSPDSRCCKWWTATQQRNTHKPRTVARTHQRGVSAELCPSLHNQVTFIGGHGIAHVGIGHLDRCLHEQISILGGIVEADDREVLSDGGIRWIGVQLYGLDVRQRDGCDPV